MRLGILDVFDDDESRTRGLQHRMLPVDSCVLFVYDGQPTYHKFWMKGVPTNLYLSAIDGGECVESIFMHANTTSPHALSARALLIVESRVEIPVGAQVDMVGDWLVVS